MDILESEKVVDDIIDLRKILDSIWNEKVLLIFVTSFFSLAAIFYSLSELNIYRAEVVTIPIEARQSNSTLANQLGGAAALIGINMPQDNGRISSVLAILRSREFISRFIDKHDLLAPLFAGTWDPLLGSGIDASLYDFDTDEWRRDGGQPTTLQAYRSFSEILKIQEDPVNGLIRLTIEWHDPTLAAKWANLIVEDINQEIKSADVEEANSAISFLRNQLQTTQLVEMQRVFYQLIESQTRIIMLADVRDEYVLQIIDAAVEPDQRVSPNRTLIVIMGTLGGVLISLLLITLKGMRQRK